MPARADILRPSGEALMKLAAERPWSGIGLRAVAEEAKVPLADLFARIGSKRALLAEVSRRLDRDVLAAPAGESDDPHDRLFDAVMARIEAMAPYRPALLAIISAENPALLAPHLPRTARAVLEAAGLDASPPRLFAMTAVWARVVQVWRDDEGALNRTMAEIDRRLKQMRRALRFLGAGY
ncbi:MAG: TetR family transcriptional regulator [Caulobacteraceae bacterium]